MVRIKITVASSHLPQHPQNRALHAFAQNQFGWTLEYDNKCWHAVIHSGEGEEVKQQLRAYGFADKDFQIRVEYQRAWGFL